jgi:hypothetical protein
MSACWGSDWITLHQPTVALHVVGMVTVSGMMTLLYHRVFNYAWGARAGATVRNVEEGLRANAGTPGFVTLETELPVKELLTEHFRARELAGVNTHGRLSRDAESNKLGDEVRQRIQQRARDQVPPVRDEKKTQGGRRPSESAHRPAIQGSPSPL